jgi:hypothetical protein
MRLVGRGAPWPLERLLCLNVKADLEDFEDCVGGTEDKVITLQRSQSSFTT